MTFKSEKTMKHIIYLLICVFALTACNTDEALPEVVPSAQGEETIEGETYHWVRIGNLEWMTSNLKAGLPYYENDELDLSQYGESMVNYLRYENDGVDFNRFGNLYEWETAVELCKELPNGWRLPSDADWQALECALGMDKGAAAADGWRGTGVATLMRQRTEGTRLAFEMSGMAGFYGGSYGNQLILRFVKEKGYFWSSTRKEDGTVYYRQLLHNSEEVFRTATDPRNIPMMRVRVCRDAR